jgi:hypothetical protein
MSVDASQLNPSAMTNTPPSDQGSVAPPQNERGYRVIPEAYEPVPGSQPAAQPDQTAASQPEVDYKERYEQEARLREQREAENQRYRQGIQQLEQGFQQQTAQQQEAQERAMILATAENMSAEEGNRYLNQQWAIRDQRKQQQMQQAIEQERQQFQQQAKVIAAKPYADHLAQSLGLSEDAKEELLALGDPDLMFQQAPTIKRRYDKWEQERAQWQGQNQQLARSTEVTALRQNGLAQMGGQNGGGTWQLEVSDDPDEAAMQIYAAQKHIEQYGQP